MNKLIDEYASPTTFDSRANYMGQTPEKDLYVLLGRNRDSDLLTESNWDCALERLGGESETVEIVRFGHWACGWIEYLCVRAESEAYKIAQDIDMELENYPVLDEGEFSEREDNEAQRQWKEFYDVSERVAYVRDNSSQFDFRDYQDMFQCIRGEYFCGYASELIN
jgi:hypothetical protein